jgi:site-specific DNA-cytosine methylase
VVGTLDRKSASANRGCNSNESDFLVVAPTLTGNIADGNRNGWAPVNEADALIWEMSHADEAVRTNGDIAPTLQRRMGTGGNQVPMVGVRRLTPLEAERLQGFPDGWTDGQSDSVRYRQLGNAVAVPVIEWLGRRIMEVHNNGRV